MSIRNVPEQPKAHRLPQTVGSPPLAETRSQRRKARLLAACCGAETVTDVVLKLYRQPNERHPVKRFDDAITETLEVLNFMRGQVTLKRLARLRHPKRQRPPPCPRASRKGKDSKGNRRRLSLKRNLEAETTQWSPGFPVIASVCSPKKRPVKADRLQAISTSSTKPKQGTIPRNRKARRRQRHRNSMVQTFPHAAEGERNSTEPSVNPIKRTDTGPKWTTAIRGVSEQGRAAKNPNTITRIQKVDPYPQWTFDEDDWKQLLRQDAPRYRVGIMSSAGGAMIQVNDRWIRPRRRMTDLPLGEITSTRLNLHRIWDLASEVQRVRLQTWWEPLWAPWEWARVSEPHGPTRISHLARDKEVLKCGIFDPLIGPVRTRMLRVFVVPKSDNTGRLVVDCRPVNSVLPKPPKMHMENVRSILLDILACRYVCQLDAKSYFYQFPLGHAAQEVLVSGIGGRRGDYQKVAWNALPMGFSWAPGIAQTTSEVIQQLSIQPGVKGHVWIDNFVFASNDKLALQKTVEVFKQLCQEVNLVLKPDEGITTRTVLLGVELDLKKKTGSLPQERSEEVAAAIAKLEKTHSTPRAVCQIIGNVIWASETVSRRPLTALVDVWLYLANNVRIWDRKNCWDRKIIVPKLVKRVLEKEARQHLTAVLEVELNAESKSRLWVDACASGGGFVCDVEGVATRFWASFLWTDKRWLEAPIFLKELFVLAQSAVHTGATDIVCDNAVAVQVFTKGHSTHPGANVLMKRFMAEIGEIHREVFSIGWIRSEDNVADAPSRGQPCTTLLAPESATYKVRWRQ
jgi:hypothetical protein